MSEPPVIHFREGTELEAWLEENGAEADELWVEIYKTHTGVKSLTWSEIVETVLCFGWIDSQRRRIDDERYRQRLTPRRARSKWSKINCEKAERLIADGRMRPSGLAEVERAKGDGRWEAAYDSPRTATVPDDLASALEERNLRDEFDALDGRSRFMILHRIQTVKRAETRARKIASFCDAIERGEEIA